jgi:hypothetical protein
MPNENIYQKISIMQERIKVNKSSRNNFADFNYRTIQDIFSELKPLLKELGLIITFGGGKLNEDKYTLGIMITDINDPTNRIDETGEIYIDRAKSKMDLSQKVLSAKTFLKKSLLEDLLLICEDDDPDSHDNTGKNNFRGNTKPNQKPNTRNDNKGTGSTEPTNKEPKKVSDKQLKRYFAIAKNRNADIKVLDDLILKAFNLAKKEDWLNSDYQKFMEYFAGDETKNIQGHSNDETINSLNLKIKSKKK